MSKKQAQKPANQDEILQAFEETKGEQLDLLAGFETEEHEPVQEEIQEAEQIAQEEPVQENQTTIADDYSEEQLYIGVDGVEYSEEEWNSPVIRNGPTRKEVEGWKKRHGHVYFTPFDGETFVWRTLQRPEYREIIRDTSLTALDREELFTEKCVLYPYDFNLEKIKKSRAGIASLLSEMIMDKSGFVAQSAPIKL